MSEKIFILGASGDIGSQLTRFLLKKNADITLYVRDVEKTRAKFPEAKDLNIIQGDYTTTGVFEKAIVGHTRLFILIHSEPQMGKIKGTFAKLAYAAGVRQIVDISSFTVNWPYKSGFISTIHREGEEQIREARGDGQFYVALRPGRFYTTQASVFGRNIKEKQRIDILNDPDQKEEYISTTDIAEVASVVLTEPVEKHANSVYHLASDSLSPNDLAATFSELLGKKITLNKVSVQEMYNGLISIGFPHILAYDLISFDVGGKATPAYEVIINRPVQTFKEWLQIDNNLSSFK